MIIRPNLMAENFYDLESTALGVESGCVLDIFTLRDRIALAREQCQMRIVSEIGGLSALEAAEQSVEILDSLVTLDRLFEQATSRRTELLIAEANEGIVRGFEEFLREQHG